MKRPKEREEGFLDMLLDSPALMIATAASVFYLVQGYNGCSYNIKKYELTTHARRLADTNKNGVLELTEIRQLSKDLQNTPPQDTTSFKHYWTLVNWTSSDILEKYISNHRDDEKPN